MYDIDIEAANNNRIIGNKFKNAVGAKSMWNYTDRFRTRIYKEH